jgi:hypothetical protein
VNILVFEEVINRYLIPLVGVEAMTSAQAGRRKRTDWPASMLVGALMLSLAPGRALAFSIIGVSCVPLQGRRLGTAATVLCEAEALATRQDDHESWLAKRTCSRLSDAHIAAFQSDGFTTLRGGVPPEFEELLDAVEAASWDRAGTKQALEELALRSPPRALACRLMDSGRTFLLAVDPPIDRTVAGICRFDAHSPAQSPSAAPAPRIDAEQMCGVVVALRPIDGDECPELLFGSHAWPPNASPRNLDKLSTWTASLERGDCIALRLHAAWKRPAGGVRMGESWREKCAVMVFGGDDMVAATGQAAGQTVGEAVGRGTREVWLDDLKGLRGDSPTSVVQWSKGVPPPDQEHYT